MMPILARLILPEYLYVHVQLNKDDEACPGQREVPKAELG